MYRTTDVQNYLVEEHAQVLLRIFLRFGLVMGWWSVRTWPVRRTSAAGLSTLRDGAFRAHISEIRSPKAHPMQLWSSTAQALELMCSRHASRC